MKFFKLIIPGLLVAATGVGAGDLITSTLAGKSLGPIIWIPLLGAVFKYFLTEGIARYQLATNETLIHGWFNHLPKLFHFIFIGYLILWSYMVGGALINGCGAAFNTIFSLQEGKIIYGILFSLLALGLVLKGSFTLFENIMAGLVGIMFLTVIGTSFLFISDSGVNFSHLFLINRAILKSPWFLSVLGGVGGTLTILCYGYWIQESDRKGKEGLRETKWDLLISYFLTGLFSVAMMILGTQLTHYQGGGSALVEQASQLFSQKLGSFGGVIFKVGFFCGVFSSLLGVWQSVPYLFCDSLRLLKDSKETDLRKTKTYRVSLIFLSLIPISSLWLKFQSIQLAYSIIGAFFIPFCCITLLYLNNFIIKKKDFKNGLIENIGLTLTLLIFIFFTYQKLS